MLQSPPTSPNLVRSLQRSSETINVTFWNTINPKVMLLFSIMIIGFLHPYSDSPPPPPYQFCFLLLPMWFKIDYCIFSFFSCFPFPLSFLLYFPFPLCSLPHFILFHKSYVFLHSPQDSKSFLESSR